MRIAVIGAGISGLAAAWLLCERHRVTLFEAADYLGGHSHTVDVRLDGVTHGVDTGFLVFNRCTYPNLTALFGLLGVEVAASEMSFSLSLAEPDLEWAGSSVGSLFAQRSNILRPAFWGMLSDILRFNRETLGVEASASPATLGEYLERHRYGEAFRDWYLLPMAAAIWSCPTGQMLDYPLATFLRFCRNHGLLQIHNRPQWLTVRGGAREYVKRLTENIADLRFATPIESVRRHAEGVQLRHRGGAEMFDQVIFACHSDQALRLLGGDASDAERGLLGAIRYQPNRAVLHTDTRLLPRRQAVWSAWNYLAAGDTPASRAVSVSYLINRLQPLPFSRPVIVSLNPIVEPGEACLLGEYSYEHPVFDSAAIDAQSRLDSLQGRRHTWFCGAWAGYGFHEDGLRSALAVANALGVRAPWQGGAPAPLREAA